MEIKMPNMKLLLGGSGILNSETVDLVQFLYNLHVIENIQI